VTDLLCESDVSCTKDPSACTRELSVEDRYN